MAVSKFVHEVMVPVGSRQTRSTAWVKPERLIQLAKLATKVVGATRPDALTFTLFLTAQFWKEAGPSVYQL